MMKNYLFLILTAPLVILIILALPGKRSFRFSGEAVLEQIGQKTHIISVHKFKELKDGEPGIQLVDLRGANEFADGHLPDAVNMPVESLSITETYRFFKSIESNSVLYADKTYQADKYWILFRQMGIENLYVLETGPVLDSMIMNWDSESSRRILVDEDPTFTFQPDTSINY
jgi:3-mercaptopyruvate sulfurtransferase SseA